MIKPFFKDNYITLVVNCSNEFVPYMDVCFQSVLDNSSLCNNYDIVVLESPISNENKHYLENKYNKSNFRIRFFNPSKILKLNKIADTLHTYSKESFYKIIIPRILSDYEKVIYSDVDIIFNCDIKEIQDIDIKDYPMAATRDFALIRHSKDDNRLCNLIPIKSIRRKYREKYKGLNYHYFKRIFGKENI